MAEYNINFSTNASQVARELGKVQTELAKAVKMAKPGGLEIKLSLNTSQLEASIDTTFRKLNKAIESNQRKLSRLQIGGSNFNLIAERLGTAEGRRERGQLLAAPARLRGQAQAFEEGSLIRSQKVLESLKIQASQIAPNTIEWTRFQQLIGEIKLELNQADKAAESIQLTQQLGALAPGSLSRLEKQLTVLRNKARDIAPNTTEWKKLNKEIQNVETSIAKVNKRPMTMSQRAGAAGGAFLYGGGLGGGAGSALGGIAGGLAGGVPGAFTGAALGQLADNIGQALGATASYTAEIDKQRIALKNVTKDVGEYQGALAFIDKTSRSLAIPQDVLNKQFTQLSASVIGAGGNINLAKEAFTGIAAGIRGTGGSLADMEGALRATAQVFSKGKVSAEELRQQIGERLPGAFTLFAKSMGKTPQELDKMLEQGQVTLNDFMSFVRTLSSEYGASASEIAASSQAAGDRLATTMSRMREAVGRELQPLGAQFQEILAKAVTDNEDNLVALAKAFSQAAQAVGSFIENYGGLIASLGSTVLLFGGTALAVKGLTAAYAALTAAIPFALAAIANYGGAVSALKLAMAGLGGPIGLTIAGLVLLSKGVYDTNETFRNFVDNIGGVIASDFKNAVDGMAKNANSAADDIQTAYEDLTIQLEPVGEFIRQLFKDVFKDTSNSAEESASASSGAFNDFFTSLSTSATEGFNGLNAIISKWWSGLPAPIRNIFGGNAASMLVGAAGYAVTLPGRTQSGAPERQGPYLPPNLPNRNAIGTPIGSFVGGGGGGGGKGGKDAKPKRIPLEQLLPAGWESALKVNLSKAELRLTELITAAKLQGNEAEAESLEGLSGSLQLRIKLAAATNFANMLRQKEGEIIAKSLTKEQFNIKLKDADNEAAELSNELKRSYLDMQVRENEAQKKAKNALNEKVKQQLSLNRLLEDAAILAGTISPQQAAISGQRRGFQDQLLQAKELGATPEQMASLQAFQAATPQVGSLQEALRGIEDEFNKLISTQEILKTSIGSMGDAFGNAFKGIITGSMSAREALAGFFQSVADSFADMVAQMIAEYLKMALIKGIMGIIGGAAGALGGGLSSGFNAGTSSAIDTGATGWASSFATPLKFANGGIAPGGFTAFANGGIVTGPTLGLVGEGKYNEAVIPLPDGKSVPVQLSGGDGGNQINSNITVNVSNGQTQSNATGSNSSELGRKIEGAVKQVIVGELRPGGLLASR